MVESYEWITDLERRAERGDPKVFLTRLNTELNKYLDKDTVEYLKTKFSHETLEYRFYGKSRRVQGLVYNTWEDRRHTVQPFNIPLDWPRWCAIDPGIRTTAALWVAVGPDEHAYAYRELYAHNEPLWQVALEIKQCEGWKLDQELTHKFGHYTFIQTPESENLVIRLIDPKSKARSEAGETSILDQLYLRYGLVCCIADNSVRPGLEDCRFWLENLVDNNPAFRVFNSLHNFLEERRVYRYRPKNRRLNQNDPIEDPIRKFNHLMDCWRYIAREKQRWNDRARMPNVAASDEYISPHTRLANKRNEEIEHEVLGVEW